VRQIILKAVRQKIGFSPLKKRSPNFNSRNRRFFAAIFLSILLCPLMALAQLPGGESSPTDETLFIEALALAESGKVEQAFGKFVKVSEQESPLAESALYEAMEMAAELGNTVEAGQIAHRFLNSFPYSVFRFSAGIHHAEALVEEGAGDKALEIVDKELLSTPEDPPGDLTLLRARALFAAERYDEALDAAGLVAYRSFKWRRSRRAVALIGQIKEASGLKSKPPTRKEMVELFEYYFDKGWFVSAGSAADKAARLYPGSNEAWRLARRKVGCLVYRNRWKTAKKLLKKVAKNKTKSKETRAYELVYSTRVGSRAKRGFSVRIKALQAAAKMAKGTRAEAEARFTMGKFFYEADNFTEAAKHYRAAALLAGGGWLAETASWKAGFALHLAGEDAEAAKVLSQLYADDPADRDADKYLYWWARTAEGAGDKDRAEEIYLQIVWDYPRTYYGLAAELRLEIMGYPDFRAQRALEEKIMQLTHAVRLGIPTLQPLGFGDDAPDIDEARDRMILEHYASHGPTAVRGAMRTVIALLDAGESGRAVKYVSIIEKQLGSDPAALYYVSVAYFLCGRELRAIVAVDAAARKIRSRELIDPYQLTARRIFPLLYFDMITEAAQEKDLDPYLVISLIKQESAFQVQSHSWAGARGLMQVIPSTGRYIARKRGIKKKFNLFDPKTSLDFGTWYFARACNGTKGDVPRTLAGYNAGPGRATRWWKENQGRSYDEVIERIPFNETRHYVKIILRNWEMYQRLYLDKELFPERENVFAILPRVVENVEYYDD
jgi:peptidoglycan lytic transglycosylase